MLSTAKKRDRFATVRALQSIEWTRSGIAGTGSITPRARRLLQLYVSLVRMEYCGLTAPLGAISETLKRALDGASSSIRTIQRANMELMDAGFIFIYSKPSNFCRIKFNLAAFSYWTRLKTDNVSPIHTHTHNVVSCETVSDNYLLTTKCRTDEVTSITPVVNSRNVSYLNQEQRAGARAINIKDSNPNRKKNRRHPVLFSLLIILRDAYALHPRDRNNARKRAECEINALGAGIGLVNPSGVDWEYWSARWEDMTIPCRENTIRREILPVLIGGKQKPTILSPHVICSDEPSSPINPVEINTVLKQFEKTFSVSQEPAKASTVSSASSPNVLSAEEYAVLDEARSRNRVNP